MTNYKATSPYFATPVNNGYLGPMVNRPIPKYVDDQQFTLTGTYNLRPDLLAYDLYGTSKLWWVFVVRNRNILKDPIYDFLPGVTIYCPGKTEVFSAIGR